MQINGYTRMAAVVAYPIKHSLSPFIHNLAFESLDVNGVYLAWEVAEENLPDVIANVKKLDMFGLNISMPYKQAVVDFMDFLTDEARLIGAVNTVVNYDGQLVGHNTDGIGFFKSLEKFDFSIENQELVILGGGGAAIAIIAQAALLGSNKIHVFARTSASFTPLKTRLTELSVQTGVEIDLTDLSNSAELQKRISQSKLLVNATSVGMDGVSIPLNPSVKLPKGLLVVDVIYKISETPFLSWAKAQGASISNGLGMLLYQAAASFEMWTGKVMPVEEIGKELLKKLEKIE